jgi:hypothetical protein
VQHAQRLEAVASDLRAYEAKREALHRELITEDEQDAWQQALVLIAGERPLRALAADEDGRGER